MRKVWLCLGVCLALTTFASEMKVNMKQYPLTSGKSSVSADGTVLKLSSGAKDKMVSSTIEIPVRQYSHYVISFEMRGNGITRTFREWVYGAGVNLQADKKVVFRGSKSGRWKHRTGTFDWEKFEVKFKTWDEQSVTLSCELASASGSAEFRNFTLREISLVRPEVKVSGTVFADANGNGKYDAGEKGIPGVRVSDGKEIAVTDNSGRYTLNRAGGRYIFASKPDNAVFVTPYYQPVAARVDFGLRQIAAKKKVVFYTLNDSECKDANGFIDPVIRERAVSQGEFLVHCGDIGDQVGHLKSMTKAGIPVYYTIGNHDFKRGKSGGEEFFEKNFGPVYHSFDQGGVHFIIMTHCAGVDVIPSSDFEQRQLQWLRRDLELNTLPVVVFRHHPVRCDDRTIALLKADKKVLALISGHTHATMALRDGGILNTECAPPNKGAVDSTPAGFLKGTVENGKIDIRLINDLSPRPAPAADAGAAPVKLAGNWAQFGKNSARESVSETKLDMPLKIRWKVQLPGKIFASSPLIVDGKVIIAVLDDTNARDGAVFALNAADGRVLWKAVTGTSVKHTLGSDGSRVYGSCADGTVFALDIANGKFLWKNKVNAWYRNMNIFSPVNLYNGRLFVSGDHWTEVNPVNVRFVRKDTKINFGSPCLAGVLIADGRIFSVENWRKGMHCNDLKTGRQLWRTSGKDYSYIDAGPAWNNGKLYQKLVGKVQMIDAATGKKLKEQPLPRALPVKESFSHPVVAGGKVFVGSAHGMFAFEAETLKPLWKFTPAPEMMLTVPYAAKAFPAVQATPAYAPGMVIFGGADGYFYLLDAESGKAVFRLDCGMPFYSSPAVSGNAVVTAAYDGTVYMFTGK